MDYTLEFEKPVSELENQIKELREATLRPNIDLSKEIQALQAKVDELVKDIYGNLTPWERVLLSRHPLRPHCSDYLQEIVSDFHEVAGDRRYGDDSSVIAGFGRVEGHKVAVVGIEKGRKTKEKVIRNFGMPRPEGYRKALRVMKLAGQFGLPILSFVDTPGAYPGIDAEERGQSQAIAENLSEMFDIPSPILAIVIGEGGSGGALGIAIADKVMMMEYSIYSVISPESCASILWSDPKQGEFAANSLKLGPQKALELKVIDQIIKEPTGGGHRNPQEAIRLVKETILKELASWKGVDKKQFLQNRFDKYRRMGNNTMSCPAGDSFPIYGREKTKTVGSEVKS